MAVPGRVVAVADAAPVRVITPPEPDEVMKLTLEAAVVAPREVKVRLAAEPVRPRSRTVAAPAVGIKDPRVSVADPVAARVPNSKVPPAVWAVVWTLKTMVLVAVSGMTLDVPPVEARSFKVPAWMLVAPW